MSRTYGWTGRIRHGIWLCPKCEHHNYYRTATIRLDSLCRAQGCTYRARVVLDRVDNEMGVRGRGRPRQVIIREYPPRRPPATIRREVKARNQYRRREYERRKAAAMQLDLTAFQTASDIQDAQDAHDLKRHGSTFRLIARPDLKRHPFTGGSRMQPTRQPRNQEEEE